MQFGKLVMWPENGDEQLAEEGAPVEVAVLPAPQVDQASALEIFDLFDISDEIRAAYFAVKQ